MSYIAKVITGNEKMLYQARIHPIFLFWYGLVALALLVLAVFLSLLFLPIMLIVALASHPFWTTEIAVTDRRLIYKRGLLSRDVEEILLDKIEGINIEQSILGRVLDYGAVRVRGVGIGEIDLPKDLDQPMEFKKALDETRI